VNRESLGVDWSDPTIQKDIVADFDSAVNSWVDAVPPHLRWDPHQPDRIFFEQSCLLYALVYTVQVGFGPVLGQSGNSPLTRRSPRSSSTDRSYRNPAGQCPNSVWHPWPSARTPPVPRPTWQMRTCNAV
jgi:hypothetical protein